MTQERFPELPEPLKEWKIVEELGSGSFGKVYLAESVEDESEFDDETDFDDEDFAEIETRAIKILQVPRDENELAYCKQLNNSHEKQVAWMKNIVNQTLEKVRLQQELKENPHIVKIYDYYVEEDPDNLRWTIYISMELLESLSDYTRRTLFGEKECLKLAIDVCDAIQAMEEHQIIHRDIKPSNILVDGEGNFKLADFGTSRRLSLDSTMSSQGTPPYSAPEVVHHERYGASIDQYSLGMSLYCLLNKGCYPFVDTSVNNHTQDEIDQAIQKRLAGENFSGPLEASEVLGQIICKACAWNPKDRFRNADHLRQTLEQYRDGRRITTKLPVYKPGNRRVERKRGRIGLIMGLMLLCSVVGYVSITYVREKDTIEMSGEETAIVKRADQTDNLLIEYQDAVDVGECSSDDARMKYLEGFASEKLSGFDYREQYLLYEDAAFSVGEIAVYTPVIQARKDLSHVEKEFEEIAFFKEDGEWKAGNMEDAPALSLEAFAKTNLPEGLLNAMAEGRNYGVFNSFNYRGVYDGLMQIDTMAAWENADSSVDVLYAIRNGCEYDDVETSYLLNLAGKEGDIVAVKGHCLIQGKAGECSLYLAHFDESMVRSEVWEDLNEKSWVYNNQNDWM